MKNIIFTALLLVFGVALNAQKNVNPVRSRTDQSDLVIEGKVIECRSYWNRDHTQILTSNVVDVSKILKGKEINKATIEIVTIGGAVDDRFCVVTHQTTFQVGMEGVFFCKNNRKLFSNLNEPNGTSFVLTYPASGFIQYFHERFNPPAAEATRTYTNIEKEIFDEAALSTGEALRDIKAEQLAKKLSKFIQIKGATNADSLTGNALNFSFKNVSLSNNLQKLTFDVFAESSVDGLRFGKSLVMIKYSSEVFGESVVSNQNISVTKGTILNNSVYTIAKTDQSTESVLLDVASNFLSPNDAYSLSTTPTQFCHVELDIENFFALANVSFDDFQMSGNSWYYDTITNKYFPFDRVSSNGPIVGTQVDDPAFIFYHIDSICVTSQATKKYLEFDLSASSNVNWTRLSQADIFINFNTTGFGNPPDATMALDAALENAGYLTLEIPYAPQDIFEFFITQVNLEDSTKHIPISTIPTRIGRVKMEIIDCQSNAGIYFVDSLMNGLQYYFAPGGVPVPLAQYEFGEEGNSDYYDQLLCVPNAPIITKIFPKKLRAGVRDTLTIEGKGFYTAGIPGEVYFRDSEFPDTTVFNSVYTSDFIINTDTLIKVLVPSILFEGQSASSGKIKVLNSLGGEATSDDPINIIFSVINIREPDTAYQMSLINQNGLGGYTFEMDGQLEAEGAGLCIKKAVETWRCLTNVNWSFLDSALVVTQVSSDDGKCVVFIGAPDSSDVFLMRTYLTGYRKICNNGLDEVYYIDNMDVEVNPYYTFAYDCSDIDTVGGIHDFYSVLLHELGHCHMLDHNVEDDEIMFTTWNEFIDAPDYNDIAGGKNVIEFSLDWKTTGTCSSITIHDTVSCKTNFVNDYNDLKYPISVYPNPFSEVVNVEIGSTASHALLINVIDLTGRNIFTHEVNSAEQTGQSVIITLGTEVPPGPYIIRITTHNNSFSTIIIKG